MDFDNIKEEIKTSYPIFASTASIIFGLASLLSEFREVFPVFLIAIFSLIGGAIITYFLLLYLKKKSLSRINPDYSVITSLDTLEIIDKSGAVANYSREMKIKIKRDLSSFYIYLPRSNGTLSGFNVLKYSSEGFNSSSTVISSSADNYLDRNALFVHEPYSKGQIVHLKFQWVLSNAFKEKEDSFAVYPDPYQVSCKLRLIADEVIDCNWFLYYSETGLPESNGSTEVKIVDSKSITEFEFAPFSKKINFKCSLKWTRK